MTAEPASPPGAVVTLMELASRARIPVTAHVHLTSRCNLPCMHCYQVRDAASGGYQVGYGPDMDSATVYRLLEDLAEMGTLMVTLTGGEALLRPDWEDILRAARRLGFLVSFFTNGVLVDEAMADRIAAAGPYDVHISVYGVTAETHEAVTCAKGSFARTRRAVELLRARGVAVKVKCPLMTVNFHEWRQVRAWAEALGCTYTFDPTITPREDGDRFPTLLRISDEQLQEAFAELALPDIDRTSRVRADLQERALAGDEKAGSNSLCGACSTTVAVVGDGRVRSCQLMHVDAGNVAEERIADVWRDARWFHEVRGLTLNNLRECRTCPDLKFCDRCSAMSLMEGGDVHGPAEELCRQAAARRAVWESANRVEDAAALSGAAMEGTWG